MDVMVCLIWRQSWTGFFNKGYPLNSLLPMNKLVSRYCFHYKNLIWKFCNITMIFFIIRVCHCNSNCHCFRIMPFLFFFWKELHNQLISCSKGNFSLWIHIYIYIPQFSPSLFRFVILSKQEDIQFHGQ